jgi:hypothetical protein
MYGYRYGNRSLVLDNYGHDFQPCCITNNISPCILQPVPQYWQAFFGGFSDEFIGSDVFSVLLLGRYKWLTHKIIGDFMGQ